MRMLLTATSILLVALLATPAATQCSDFEDLEILPFGAGCTAFGAPVTLSGAFSDVECAMSLTLSSNPGCCNTFITQRFLLFGIDPTILPFPEGGPGCNLLLDPLLITVFPAALGETFNFHIPDGIPGGTTILTQGAVDYFTTIGLTHDYPLSNGLQLVFS